MEDFYLFHARPNSLQIAKIVYYFLDQLFDWHGNSSQKVLALARTVSY